MSSLTPSDGKMFVADRSILTLKNKAPGISIPRALPVDQDCIDYSPMFSSVIP